MQYEKAVLIKLAFRCGVLPAPERSEHDSNSESNSDYTNSNASDSKSIVSDSDISYDTESTDEPDHPLEVQGSAATNTLNTEPPENQRSAPETAHRIQRTTEQCDYAQMHKSGLNFLTMDDPNALGIENLQQQLSLIHI